MSEPDRAYHDAPSDVATIRRYLVEYWKFWGEKYGYQVEFKFGEYDALYELLGLEQLDILAITTHNPKLTSWVRYSLPYIEAKSVLVKRIGDSIEGGGVGLHMPKTLLPADFNPKNLVTVHSTQSNKLLNQIDQLNYVYSWSPKNFLVELDQAGVADEFYVQKTAIKGLPIRALTKREDAELMIKVNSGIRSISSKQSEELWLSVGGRRDNSFRPLSGTYLPNINIHQERLLAEKPVKSYAYIVDGEEPYFITEGFFMEGYIVDVMRNLSQKLGVTFEAKPYSSFQDALDAVKNQEVDIFPGIYKTDQRLSSLSFTSDIDRTVLAIASEENYYAISQLKGKRLALVRGLYENELLSELLPINPIIYLDTAEEAMRAVAEGRADAYVGKLLNSAYMLNKHKLYTLNLHKAEDLDNEYWPRIALPKSESKWVSLLNLGLYNLGESFQQDLQVKWKEHLVFSQETERVRELYKKIMLASGLLIMFLLFCFVFYRYQLANRKEVQATLEKALHEAETAKKEAEEMTLAKSDFLARMSHEIRTPMNGVLGMAEALSFTQLSNEQEDLLHTLNGSARNLMALLNDVLDFSKMDAGKLTLEQVHCDLESLMSSVVGNFKHKANAKEVGFDSRIDRSLNKAYLCDSTRLMQVLNNLVSNSVKFTNDGFVELSAQLIASDYKRNADGQYYDLIGFQVRDSGIGIAKDKLETLFDPFVQADGDITRRFGGTGLGLSICSEIVAEMGGEIRVSSVIGHGSLFSITLPLLVDKAEKVIKHDDALGSMPTVNQLGKLKVLFAEDNAVNRKVIGGQLKRLGVNFDIAENGRIAYDKYSENPTYDVILSDCHMPEMDGFTLAKTISAEFADNKPAMIAITADALSGAAKRCLSAGFDDYISKPCPLDVLENKLLQAANVTMVEESDFEQENELLNWLDENSLSEDVNEKEPGLESWLERSDLRSEPDAELDELLQDEKTFEVEIPPNDDGLDWKEIHQNIADIELDDKQFSLSQKYSENDNGKFEPYETLGAEIAQTASSNVTSDSSKEDEQNQAYLDEVALFESELAQFELSVAQDAEDGELSDDFFSELEHGGLAGSHGEHNEFDLDPITGIESINVANSEEVANSNFSLPDTESFEPSHVLAMSGDDQDIALDILETFLNNYLNDIDELLSVGASQDASAIRDTAHRIKGSALYLGNEPIATVAKALEAEAASARLINSESRIEFIARALSILGEEIAQYCEELKVA